MRVARSRSLVVLLVLGVLIILALSTGPAALAGPKALISDMIATPSWTGMVPGPAAGADAATDVILLPGNVTLVCGSLTNAAGDTDISLVKYKNNVLQWTKSWGGTAGAGDVARKMALSPDGKYVYICGTASKSAGNADIYVLKRAVSTGGLAWAKRYDGPAHLADVAVAVGVDSAGNVVVAGASLRAAADSDYVVASWKASGKARWTWRWDGGHGLDVPYDMLVTPAGDCYVTGASIAAGAKIQAATARLSATGAKKWLKKYLGDAGLGAGMSSITPRPGGGVYVAGWTATVGDANDAIIARYAAGGGRTTVATDAGGAGAANEMYWDVTVLSTKDVMGAGFTTVGADQQPRVGLYSPAGALVFQGTKLTAGSDAFTACAADAFGGWYITAAVHDAPATRKVWTYRSSVFISAGLWQSNWGGVASADYSATAIAVQGTSCAVVGQAPSGGLTGLDQMVLMYNY
jgi:hypothetical protein